jgi:hypothetical protein
VPGRYEQEQQRSREAGGPDVAQVCRHSGDVCVLSDTTAPTFEPGKPASSFQSVAESSFTRHVCQLPQTACGMLGTPLTLGTHVTIYEDVQQVTRCCSVAATRHVKARHSQGCIAMPWEISVFRLSLQGLRHGCLVVWRDFAYCRNALALSS